ncbi:hypothetical protein ACSTG8_23405, partial [Vibrio parahaemolyticus]
TYWQAVNELAAASRANVPTSQIKPNPFWEHFFPGWAGGGLSATQAIYENELKYYPTDITSALLDLDEL